MKESIPAYQQERKTTNSNNDLLMCGLCLGFFSKAYFFRHKRDCKKREERNKQSIGLPLSLIEADSTLANVSEDFKTSVLGGLRDSEVKDLIMNDELLLIIGNRLHNKIKRRKGKEMEAIKVVRADLRRLANLYRLFLQRSPARVHCSVLDMFERQNFEVLRDSIIEFTVDDANNLKCGLKHILHYTIKSAAIILKGTFLTRERDDLSSKIDNFLAIYKLNKEDIFGDALYQLNKNRQIKLRKPAMLPQEQDVELLRNYAINLMREITTDVYTFWDAHVFVQIRDSCCVRLTLFNGRRGGEPARLLLEELNDAINDEWINKQSLELLNPTERKCATQFKITYQSGKGTNHLVPILIPEDTLAALMILMDPLRRIQGGVNSLNRYVFANTQDSLNHICGSQVTIWGHNMWVTISQLCDKANVQNKSTLTATAQRHRVSTMFAALDLPDSERNLFYSHMGHSREMNEQVYQAPQALMEVTRLGKKLATIDNGNNNLLFFVIVVLREKFSPLENLAKQKISNRNLKKKEKRTKHDLIDTMRKTTEYSPRYTTWTVYCHMTIHCCV